MTAVEDSEPRTRIALSIGKRRALQALSTPEHVFAILAVDHIAALAAVVRPDSPESVSVAELIALKVHLVASISQPASAVLIDPILGLGPIIEAHVLPGTSGLLMGLEDGDYASLDGVPRLFEGWDVARAARSGATAIKISFLYDPSANTNAAHGFVSSVVESCRRHELPLFAEPLLPADTRGDRRNAVIETARTIGALGVDVLKLEFPYATDSTDTGAWRDACLELTAASPCPWTLLSGGADLATFSRQLTVACDSGASGYVAGRAIWKDLVATDRDNNGSATIEAHRRLQSLTDIAVAHATPWRAWFEESV